MNPLLVPELFHHILDYVTTQSSEDPLNLMERRTLAALARTCSAFSEPSLDRLWRRLDSLLPLIPDCPDIVDEVRLKKHTCPQGWLVINRHSHRVQELTLGPEESYLRCLQHMELVLPSVNVLRWECQSRATMEREMIPFSHFWPLVTPNINTLEVASIYPSNPKFQSFLENYSLHCPNLRSIKFSVPLSSQESEIVTQSLSQAICSRADWHCVQLSGTIDKVALRHLGLGCSSLRAVSFTFVRELMRPYEPYFGPTETPFSTVTELALTVWSHLDTIMPLLRASDQGLSSFKLTLRSTDSGLMDLSSLLHVVVSPRRIHSLQSLMIKRYPRPRIRGYRSTMGPGIAGLELSYEMLRPIASLVHLRELVIALDIPLTINDAEFASLVCNWPCIEVLWLTGVCEGIAWHAISLKGLSSLLVHCPKLHEIRLSLDAREIPALDDLAGLGISAGMDAHRPLVTHLFLQDALVQHPNLVDKFLSKHFPSVRWADRLSFEASSPASHEKSHSRLWTRVNTWLRNQTSAEVIGLMIWHDSNTDRCLPLPLSHDSSKCKKSSPRVK